MQLELVINCSLSVSVLFLLLNRRITVLKCSMILNEYLHFEKGSLLYFDMCSVSVCAAQSRFKPNGVTVDVKACHRFTASLIQFDEV